MLGAAGAASQREAEIAVKPGRMLNASNWQIVKRHRQILDDFYHVPYAVRDR
jgi:hypothetical protein